MPNGGQAQALTSDQANRLTKFAAASTSSYGYNGNGLRMCKYAGSSSQPCQATGNTPYLWDIAGSLPTLLKDGTTNYIYSPGGCRSNRSLEVRRTGTAMTKLDRRD